MVLGGSEGQVLLRKASGERLASQVLKYLSKYLNLTVWMYLDLQSLAEYYV